MTDLVVYENHDVFLEHAIHTYIPTEINGLEYFLQHVSAQIAASSGDVTASGRYRFVYSLTGRPLWRVADCRSAGKIVVSCTPGFLRRKQSGAAAVASSASLQSHTLQRERQYQRCEQSPSINSLSFSEKIYSQPSRDFTTTTTAVSESHESDVPDTTLPWPGPPFYERNSPERVEVEQRRTHSEDSHLINGDVDLGRTTFTVAGRRVALPSTPRFVDPPLLGAAEEMTHSDRISTVQTLLSLKFIGGPFVVDELLFRKELNLCLASVIGRTVSRRVTQEERLRVVVEGPPRSGVTTTLAYCSYLAASMAEGPLSGSLFLPLNFELLFDDAWVSSEKNMRELNANKLGAKITEQQKLMLDVPFFFMTLVRHVMDCAIIQRPSLRSSSQVLVEAWEHLVLSEHARRNKNMNDALRFGSSALVQLVGHQAVHQWEVFAAGALEILCAAQNAPHDMELRDILLETVLIRFVAQIASGLRFSGVVFVVDGLRYAAGVLRHRVHRPLGDAGVFLRCLARTQWAHVMIGIDTLAHPSCGMLFPAKLRRVRLLHIIPPHVLMTDYGYPADIRCGGKTFPLQLFLGAPGYLRVLHALLGVNGQPVREESPGTRYVLRVEDRDVFNALQDLTSVLCK